MHGQATKSLFDEVQGMTSEYFYNMKLTPMFVCAVAPMVHNADVFTHSNGQLQA